MINPIQQKNLPLKKGESLSLLKFDVESSSHQILILVLLTLVFGRDIYMINNQR